MSEVWNHSTRTGSDCGEEVERVAAIHQRDFAKGSDFLNRPLDELDLPVIMIDGLHVGEQVVLGVIGIDTSGNKHVLGLCDGPSESDRVCQGCFAV
jgi:hypothetical protein